jgi:hypothetical protein
MSRKLKLPEAPEPNKSRRAALCGMAAALGVSMGMTGVLAMARQDDPIVVTGHSSEKPETPFACSLEKSLTKEQRAHKKQIALKMESARIETKEIADGYVFRFRPDGVSFAEIADWVATERVCCPFFDLAIEAERENGPLSLRISGREGVKNFIRGEFQTLKLK